MMSGVDPMWSSTSPFINGHPDSAYQCPIPNEVPFDWDMDFNSNDRSCFGSDSSIDSISKRRSSIGPNKTYMDDKLRNIFTVDMLLSNKDEWSYILKQHSHLLTYEKSVRVKQLRRRELQKVYNSALRERKKGEHN